MLQPIVGYLGRIKVQVLEIRKPLEVNLASVTHLRFFQMETTQGGKPLELGHAGIGHLGAAQVQVDQLLKTRQVDEPLVGEAVPLKMKVDFQCIGVESHPADGAPEFFNCGRSRLLVRECRGSQDAKAGCSAGDKAKNGFHVG